MNLALNVLFGVVDESMKIIRTKATVSTVGIGIELRTRLNMLVDDGVD